MDGQQQQHQHIKLLFVPRQYITSETSLFSGAGKQQTDKSSEIARMDYPRGCRRTRTVRLVPNTRHHGTRPLQYIVEGRRRKDNQFVYTLPTLISIVVGNVFAYTSPTTISIIAYDEFGNVCEMYLNCNVLFDYHNGAWTLIILIVYYGCSVAGNLSVLVRWIFYLHIYLCKEVCC